MKYLIPVFVLLLSGCSTTVPVTAKFPETPKHIMQICPQLESLQDDAKLSDIAKTVTINYTQYYSCAIKVDAWIQWYEVQKRIFEGTVK